MPLTNVDPNITSQMTANLISAFIPTMNNSVNLTGEITATLVHHNESLKSYKMSRI